MYNPTNQPFDELEIQYREKQDKFSTIFLTVCIVLIVISVGYLTLRERKNCSDYIFKASAQRDLDKDIANKLLGKPTKHLNLDRDGDNEACDDKKSILGL